MRLGWLVASGVVVALALVAIGFSLADLSTIRVCEGPIADTVLCEGARLRQSIFAAALALGGIVSAAVLIAAFVVAHRPRRSQEAPSPAAAPSESEGDSEAVGD